MEAALEAARAKDMKGRLAGVERLHEALDAAARRGLTPAEVASLVDTCVDLTGDGNFRVVQGALQALSAAAVLAGDHFKVHLNAFVPVAVERLGDGKQPVRHAARQLLVTLMEVGSICCCFCRSDCLLASVCRSERLFFPHSAIWPTF
jgi:CLIP-associating protein 1/2